MKHWLAVFKRGCNPKVPAFQVAARAHIEIKSPQRRYAFWKIRNFTEAHGTDPPLSKCGNRSMGLELYGSSYPTTLKPKHVQQI